MICTEQEAKETACCKERAYLENGKLVTPACLASGCMAWRNCYEEEGKGYCGLAGVPTWEAWKARELHVLNGVGQ